MEEQLIKLMNQMNGRLPKRASYCSETKTVSLGNPETGRVLKIPLGAEGFFCFSLIDRKEVEGILDLFSVEVQRSIEKALRLNSDSSFYCEQHHI